MCKQEKISSLCLTLIDIFLVVNICKTFVDLFSSLLMKTVFIVTLVYISLIWKTYFDSYFARLRSWIDKTYIRRKLKMQVYIKCTLSYLFFFINEGRGHLTKVSWSSLTLSFRQSFAFFLYLKTEKISTSTWSV